mgnify:FL=1
MKFATFRSDARTRYGAVTNNGIIALDEIFPQWPTLFDAVIGSGLDVLTEAALKASVTHKKYKYEIFKLT